MLGLDELLTLRMYGATANAIGELVHINFINGDIIEGLFFSLDAVNNSYFIIKDPRRMSRTNKVSSISNFIADFFKRKFSQNFLQRNSLSPL